MRVGCPDGLTPDIHRLFLPRSVCDMSHRLQEDLLESVAAMGELSDQQVLPGQQVPHRLDLHVGRKHDAPAAAPFADTVGADFRQRVAQMLVVAGDFEFDEALVRAPLFLEIALVSYSAVLYVDV